MKLDKITELDIRDIVRQQFTDHIIFGISGIELTENSIRNMTLGEVEEVLHGQADKETNREDSSGT